MEDAPKAPKPITSDDIGQLATLLEGHYEPADATSIQKFLEGLQGEGKSGATKWFLKFLNESLTGAEFHADREKKFLATIATTPELNRYWVNEPVLLSILRDMGAYHILYNILYPRTKKDPYGSDRSRGTIEYDYDTEEYETDATDTGEPWFFDPEHGVNDSSGMDIKEVLYENYPSLAEALTVLRDKLCKKYMDLRPENEVDGEDYENEEEEDDEPDPQETADEIKERIARTSE